MANATNAVNKVAGKGKPVLQAKMVSAQMVQLTGKVCSFSTGTARHAYYTSLQQLAGTGQGIQLAQLLHTWGATATCPSWVAGCAPKKGPHCPNGGLPEPAAGWLGYFTGGRKSQPIALCKTVPVQIPANTIWQAPKA